MEKGVAILDAVAVGLIEAAALGALTPPQEMSIMTNGIAATFIAG